LPVFLLLVGTEILPVFFLLDIGTEIKKAMTITSLTLVLGRRLPLRALHELFERFREGKQDANDSPPSKRIKLEPFDQKAEDEYDDDYDDDLRACMTSDALHEWMTSDALLKLLNVQLVLSDDWISFTSSKMGGKYGYREFDPFRLRFYHMTHDSVDDGIQSYVLGVSTHEFSDDSGEMEMHTTGTLPLLSHMHDHYYLLDHFFEDYHRPIREMRLISELNPFIAILPLQLIIIRYAEMPWLTEIAGMFLSKQTGFTKQTAKTALSKTRLFTIQNDCNCCS
jgi:hypothetical protein